MANYKDTALNRRMGRVGKPHGSADVTKAKLKSRPAADYRKRVGTSVTAKNGRKFKIIKKKSVAQGPAPYKNPMGQKAEKVEGKKRTPQMATKNTVKKKRAARRPGREVEEWKMPHILKKYAVGRTSKFFKIDTYSDGPAPRGESNTGSYDRHGEYTVTKHTATGISFKNAAGKRKTMSYLNAGHTV